MAKFLTFKGLWPWPSIRSYCILSCITHRTLPTYRISLKSKKLFVDGRTDGRLRPTLLGRLGGVDLKNKKCNTFCSNFHAQLFCHTSNTVQSKQFNRPLSIINLLIYSEYTTRPVQHYKQNFTNKQSKNSQWKWSITISKCISHSYSPWQMDLERDVVVKVRKCNPVLSTDWLSDDDLVDVVEFIPVFISAQQRRCHGQRQHNVI